MKGILLLAMATLGLAGCATQPADYAATLSAQDPKWHSPECVQIRAAALSYKDGETMSVPASLLLGPYGLGMALAGKEHQAKKRRQFARNMHMQCSSQPLPQNLNNIDRHVAMTGGS